MTSSLFCPASSLRSNLPIANAVKLHSCVLVSSKLVVEVLSVSSHNPSSVLILTDTVRLQGGGVAVFSPVALTDEVKKTVAELGEVKYIIAPDLEVCVSIHFIAS
jgi:hypothetical protein